MGSRKESFALTLEDRPKLSKCSLCTATKRSEGQYKIQSRQEWHPPR